MEPLKLPQSLAEHVLCQFTNIIITCCCEEYHSLNLNAGEGYFFVDQRSKMIEIGYGIRDADTVFIEWSLQIRNDLRGLFRRSSRM